MFDVSLLTPLRFGAEHVNFENGMVRAESGTGFDPDSEQHKAGSDAVRYAIAIQQFRDAGDYDKADRAREMVRRFGYGVGTAKGETVVTGGQMRRPLVMANGVVFDG